MTSIDISDELARSIDWPSFQVRTGEASDFGNTLIMLLHSRDADHARQIWDQRIDEVVFSQSTIFSAAEPTIDVLLAALAQDKPTHVKATAIELLLFLLTGGSVDDPELSRRCRERALRGTWLLTRQALAGRDWAVDVIELLEILDPAQASKLRLWLNV